MLRKLDTKLRDIPDSLRANPAAAAFVLGLVLILLTVGYGVYDVAADWQKVPLFGGQVFSQTEFTGVAAAFAKARLTDYDIRDGEVRIPKRKRAEYIGALVDANALPMRFDLYFEDFASRSNPFESPKQRDLRLQMAKQRELALILRKMAAIEDATVHYDMTQPTGIHRQVEMTAMVAVRPAAGAVIDAQLLRSIRQLIAASKAGLTCDRVTVCDLSTGVASSGAGDGQADNSRNEQYQRQKMAYEDWWNSRIAEMVSISGVTVETSAEFSAPPETSYGAEQNLSGLSILFGVPRGYFQARGRSADPKSTLTSRDLERIKSDTGNEVLALVQNLLTNQRKQLAPDAVRVVTYEQLASKADSVKTVPQVGLRGWMRQHARWIVLGIASLVAVLLLRDMSRELARTRRGMSKSRMSSEEPRERSESEHVVTDPGVVLPMAETRGEESEDGEQTHDNYIHETLTDVVREDPQAAAAMLRNWVEKAG